MKRPEVDGSIGAAQGKVAVLMATYNGAQFIASQIDTIRAQLWRSIDLIVSDDGSADTTLVEVARQAENWTCGLVTVLEGPRRGFSENFRNLIVNASVDADYVAFSDQDDLWHPRKLEAAVNWLDSQPSTLPALFCGRTAIFSSDGASHLSLLFARPPDFRNALVQSLAGGNTMVMNRAAFDLIKEASRRTGFVSHDWWAYLLVTGAGGRVYYSRKPYTRYRQHEDNQVGANDTWKARALRIFFLLEGRFRRWTDSNLDSLSKCRDLLTPEAQDLLEQFIALRRAWMPVRLWRLKKIGVYRQTRRGQLGLYVASAFNAL